MGTVFVVAITVEALGIWVWAWRTVRANLRLTEALEEALADRELLIAEGRALRIYLAGRGITVVNFEADLSELAAVRTPADIHFPDAPMTGP